MISQKKTLTELQKVLSQDSQIDFAFMEGKTISDSALTINCVVGSDFDSLSFLSRLESHFSGNLVKSLITESNSQIILYFRESPKLVITFSKSPTEYILVNSDINYPFELSDQVILFDKTGVAEDFLKEENYSIDQKMAVSGLLDNFVYEFERCSESHRRGDGYLFYRYYNNALDVAVKLCLISKGNPFTPFLPRNFISKQLGAEEQKFFHELRGSLHLQDANRQKRKLLDFFYSSIGNLIPFSQNEEIHRFCEEIFTRDFLWNFRDISRFNPRIKPGFIYRSASLTIIQNEAFFEEFIRERKIKTVVDLRSTRESSERGYTENSLNSISWITAPIDHLNYQMEFQKINQLKPSAEETYRYFVNDCHQAIKKAVEAILLEKNAVAIHCHSGKDRTGFLVSLLHLLSGADLEKVYEDYLASEMDTKKEYLEVALSEIEKINGIENYFLRCGFSLPQIHLLKQRLLEFDPV